MLINLCIKDVGRGIQLSGALNAEALEPTPAEIFSLYLATHPEVVAQQSWNWYAAQRTISKLTQE